MEIYYTKEAAQGLDAEKEKGVGRGRMRGWLAVQADSFSESRTNTLRTLVKEA